jgi:hypothetical protein
MNKMRKWKKQIRRRTGKRNKEVSKIIHFEDYSLLECDAV